MRGLQKNKKKGKNMVRVEAKWKKKGRRVIVKDISNYAHMDA